MDNARDLSSEAETDELEALVEELKLRNDFERLGVDFNATPEEIKIAYRKLALQYHPDRAGADASSAVKEVFDQAFRLIDQAYDRLVSGEGRKTSVDAKSKARSARAVDTTSEKASTKIYLLLTLRSLYDPIMREPDIDQLLINLDFGNEASHPDPIYFQQLRSQVIHQSMNGIISKAPLARVGKIIDFIDALYYLEVVSENVVEEWHRQIDKRLDTFTPSTPDELITNFYNRVRSGPEGLGSRLMGDTPDYYARTAVSALAENLQISEEEAAFQALEKLIELKGQKALLNGAKNYNTPGHDRLLRALINLSIQNFSVDDAEIVARVQSLILKFPHYGDLHSFLISSIPSRAREKLVSIFGYKYLRSNNVRLSGAENFKALFDFSNFSNELQKAKAANNNHQTDLVRVQARQLVSSAQVDGSIFIGEATGSIDLAELEKITRMKFEKAKRYIEEQHGVRIIVLRNEYTDPKEFWYYHLLFARDNLKGAYIPASSDSKNERAFQDKPLIVVREEHLSSLPHEFAHHLIFQSIQSASEARGLDNQLVSPYRKANQISDSMGSKSSAIWSSELKLTQPNLFSSQDIRLFLDYSIYRAQARFQRLREELAVDRAQIRTSTDPQTTQERIDHMMLELKSFDKEIRNLTYQMNRRLTRHSRYMTNEEIAQFNKVLQHLYDLKKSVTAKLDDPSYRGPIELLDVSSRAEASTSIDNILLIE
ncbi:MAG: hypothetical protein COV44_05500 [Deltaproteobacteria bacterium CG11_big_fil_rev_8_21_14_0_20_45_16]|nr:MAG: hypothetical protein COV44_05500 [Deltaproteobacteria bacterium CG11_big_fil_rev_8_21_14_0_20_45_16]